MENREQIMFRFVPTMRCNFRCDYCFIESSVKTNGDTMFDRHSVKEWVEGIKNFSQYDIEPYFWGGEPFCIDETYEFLKELVQLDNICSGFRIDTNVFFADKIAKRCPSSKIKLNCSFHMQYHSLDDEVRKVRLLKELDMIGMVNFVASKYNLTHLQRDYHMGIGELIEIFSDMDVFLNVAGDFAYANNKKYERYNEYKEYILQFTSPEDWEWLRSRHVAPRLCKAGQKMFTVEHDGTFTSCIDSHARGNFFQGILHRDESPSICAKECPSIVSYPFRCDNDFPSTNSLLEYVERNKKYRNKNVKYKEFIFS